MAWDFENDFEVKTGIKLSGHPSVGNSNMVKVFQARMTDYVMEYVKENNAQFVEADLTAAQTEAIERAIIEQGFYVLNVGDLNTYAGIDTVTGQVTALNEIRSRVFSPFAKKILSNAGLLFKGISTKGQLSYAEQRRYWR